MSGEFTPPNADGAIGRYAARRSGLGRALHLHAAVGGL
jgi:hypothetical protein